MLAPSTEANISRAHDRRIIGILALIIGLAIIFGASTATNMAARDGIFAGVGFVSFGITWALSARLIDQTSERLRNVMAWVMCACLGVSILLIILETVPSPIR